MKRRSGEVVGIISAARIPRKRLSPPPRDVSGPSGRNALFEQTPPRRSAGTARPARRGREGSACAGPRWAASDCAQPDRRGAQVARSGPLLQLARPSPAQGCLPELGPARNGDGVGSEFARGKRSAISALRCSGLLPSAASSDERLGNAAKRGVQRQVPSGRCQRDGDFDDRSPERELSQLTRSNNAESSWKPLCVAAFCVLVTTLRGRAIHHNA